MAAGVGGHYGQALLNRLFCFAIGKLQNSTIRAKPDFIRPQAGFIRPEGAASLGRQADFIRGNAPTFSEV